MFNDAAIQGEVDKLYSQLPPNTRAASIVTYDGERKEFQAWGAVKLKKGWTLFAEIDVPKSAPDKLKGQVGLIWAGE